MDTITEQDWPNLPPGLIPGKAYGVLQVRAGPVPPDDEIDEDDEIIPEGTLRYRELAWVDLDSGDLSTEVALSRDNFDLGYDDVVFVPYKTSYEIAVEDGVKEAFGLDEDDLPELSQIWVQCLADHLSERTQPARGGRSSPRL